MESFTTELSSFFRWLLVSTIQVSVLVCLILVIKAVIRRRLAVRWHYWLWLLLLVRMVMPWAPESSFSVFALTSQAKKAIAAEHIAKVTPSAETVDVTEVVAPKTTSLQRNHKLVKPAETTPQPTQAPAGASLLSFEVIDVLSLVWLIVALALAIFALACNFRLWRIIKSQRPLTEGKILDLLEDCKAEMGVPTILGLIVTDKVKSPALFGVVRPRLLLPEGTIKTLSTEQLRYVFLHELAHLKRHDIYLGWLMVVLQVLHWFNPLVWLAFARMRADRELACDGLVLSTMGSGESQAYGQTLVNLFKGFSRTQFVPGIAGILENKSQLKRRITMIARFKKGSYRWSVLAVVLLAVLACVALTNAQGETQTENKEPKVMAKEFVELLVKGQFSKATENFDATMKKSLPADKLAETWRTTTGQAGLFNRQLGIRTEKYLSYDIALVTCEFEKGPLDVKVVYNDKREVSGLYFIPTPQEVLKGYQGQQEEQEIPALMKKLANRAGTYFRQLSKAEEKKDWNSVNEWAKYLRDIFRQSDSKLTERQGDKAQQFCEVIHILAELSDDLHDAIRDEKMQLVAPLYQQLTEEWRDFLVIVGLSEVTVDIDHSPNNQPLTVQYAVIAICEAAGIPYQWEKSARLADPERRNFIEPIHIEDVPLEKALLDVLTTVGLRYELDENGLYLYRPTDRRASREDRAKMRRRTRTTRATTSRSRAALAAPQVISTNPVALSNDVSPDLTEITVTFDQPMMNLSWSWVGGGKTFPETRGQPRYDREKMTCSFPVKLESGRFYWIGINSPRFKNFQTDMGVPAVPYAILFATKDKEGNPTPIPENFIEETKEINARSRPAEPAVPDKPSNARVRGQGKSVELSNDDGSSESRESIAGSGHAVIFEAPAEGCILKAVRIYGSRYGHPKPPKEDFHIWLCDEDFSVIKDFPFSYARFRKGNPKWVTLRVKAIEVPSTFVICAGFNPEQTKGVYVHYDDSGSGSGNSFIALPGQDRRVFNRGEWMIRAVVQQSSSQSRTVIESRSENGQSPLGKWESVDFVRKVEDFKPGQKSWRGKLFLEGIDFFKGGGTSNPMMPTWDEEWILHWNGQTKARYIIKEIDETTYLFLPWLSGDVTERGQKPSYYVLKKAGKATKADKMEAENLTAEGWNLWRQRKLAEAEAKFKQAVKKDAKNDNAYQGLGWAQLNQGKKLHARDSFEKCVEINPKNSAALNGLG